MQQQQSSWRGIYGQMVRTARKGVNRGPSAQRGPMSTMRARRDWYIRAEATGWIWSTFIIRRGTLYCSGRRSSCMGRSCTRFDNRVTQRRDGSKEHIRPGACSLVLKTSMPEKASREVWLIVFGHRTSARWRHSMWLELQPRILSWSTQAYIHFPLQWPGNCGRTWRHFEQIP